MRGGGARGREVKVGESKIWSRKEEQRIKRKPKKKGEGVNKETKQRTGKEKK